jgi:hypothetical protein
MMPNCAGGIADPISGIETSCLIQEFAISEILKISDNTDLSSNLLRRLSPML